MTFGEVVVYAIAIAVIGNALDLVTKRPTLPGTIQGAITNLTNHLVNPAYPLLPDPKALAEKQFQNAETDCQQRCAPLRANPQQQNDCVKACVAAAQQGAQNQ